MENMKGAYKSHEGPPITTHEELKRKSERQRTTASREGPKYKLGNGRGDKRDLARLKRREDASNKVSTQSLNLSYDAVARKSDLSVSDHGIQRKSVTATEQTREKKPVNWLEGWH